MSRRFRLIWESRQEQSQETPGAIVSNQEVQVAQQERSHIGPSNCSFVEPEASLHQESSDHTETNLPSTPMRKRRFQEELTKQEDSQPQNINVAKKQYNAFESWQGSRFQLIHGGETWTRYAHTVNFHCHLSAFDSCVLFWTLCWVSVVGNGVS